MAQYVYTMQGVTKIVPPQRTILENIHLSFFPGAKIGVLGLNGSGKSSLLRIMAGEDTDIEGEARPQKDIRVGYLPQEPALDEDLDVRGNVELGVAEIMGVLKEYNEISDKFAEPMDDDEMTRLLERQGDLATQIDAVDGWEIDRTLDIAADALRLPAWDTPVNMLSGGERRRVALCSLLLSKPDMLLLDEPTNHLDAESVSWLERFLDEYAGTVVAVTHDRYFLDNVASWILELDRGRGLPYEGNYTNWLENKEARLAQEASRDEAKQRVIKAELEWVRSNAKGKRTKSKSRLARFDDLVAAEEERRNETGELFIPTGERLGEKVMVINNLSKGFGERLLIDNFNAIIPRGAIVGIIGGNGAGKSTFFKMLTGQETPDTGNIEIGSTVQMAYVDQSRDELSDDKTVWEEVSDNQDIMRIGKHEIASRAYVGRFNFKGTDQQKFVGKLSGGERNRVHLAKLLRRGANVLLLDEPTNDLDVETLRALEEAILTFAGTALVISHDRWFLDRVATHIIAFEGDSDVIWYEGNYSEYEVDRKKRLGDSAPTRVQYKPIHR
ncbi:energy-dependent translational throttle protein EttA [Pseudomonadales bacterium]|nr:energy-dependent translational throttle protein EttA [Pseudomonadales bacterium]MDA8953868.1 energy-dependent translational throttle protein EttA [Pseudomonadales bacterium]MDB0050608.1 energy-dependent translational throttle protein EttA [Pseudomonadales bacterium]MDB2596326.1 energy-dependent translational throttle protein EttA [Pseudomonadales bacterium]